MNLAWFVAICAATFLSACSGTRNDEHAYFATQGQRYVVELTGQRRLMAHDPISAMRGRTYEETLTIELPKIEGVIDGTDIPVRSGSVPYTGRVVISAGQMTVDLYYRDHDHNTNVALLWNDTYTLVPRDAEAAR